MAVVESFIPSAYAALGLGPVIWLIDWICQVQCRYYMPLYSPESSQITPRPPSARMQIKRTFPPRLRMCVAAVPSRAYVAGIQTGNLAEPRTTVCLLGERSFRNFGQRRAFYE